MFLFRKVLKPVLLALTFAVFVSGAGLAADSQEFAREPNYELSRFPQDIEQYHLAEGWASQYGKGVMQRVIRVRQAGRTSRSLPMDLPQVDGYAAALSADAIGQIWYIQPEGHSHWERILIVDCGGADGGASWMARNNILVEVDYETAERWETLGRGKRVRVLAPPDGIRSF